MMQYVDFSNVFLNNKNIFQKLPNKLGNKSRHLMNLVVKRTHLLTILLGAEMKCQSISCSLRVGEKM